MGYWENTAYIRSSDARRLAETIGRLFADEQMFQVASPEPRTPEPFDSMQYATSDRNVLWAVAIMPGLAGWTVIKTAPFELLIERPDQAAPMRLGQLCRKMRADGFQYNIYDSSERVLVEASASGRIRLSGFCESCPGILLDPSGESATFNGEPFIPGADRFGLIDPGAHIRNAISVSADERALGRMLASNEAYDNLVQVQYLIPHRPVPILGTTVQYFRRRRGHAAVHPPHIG